MWLYVWKVGRSKHFIGLCVSLLEQFSVQYTTGKNQFAPVLIGTIQICDITNIFWWLTAEVCSKVTFLNYSVCYIVNVLYSYAPCSYVSVVDVYMYLPYKIIF